MGTRIDEKLFILEIFEFPEKTIALFESFYVLVLREEETVHVRVLASLASTR